MNEAIKRYSFERSHSGEVSKKLVEQALTDLDIRYTPDLPLALSKPESSLVVCYLAGGFPLRYDEITENIAALQSIGILHEISKTISSVSKTDIYNARKLLHHLDYTLYTIYSKLDEKARVFYSKKAHMVSLFQIHDHTLTQLFNNFDQDFQWGPLQETYETLFNFGILKDPQTTLIHQLSNRSRRALLQAALGQRAIAELSADGYVREYPDGQGLAIEHIQSIIHAHAKRATLDHIEGEIHLLNEDLALIDAPYRFCAPNGHGYFMMHSQSSQKTAHI